MNHVHITEIKRSKRRGIKLVIRTDASLIVRAPRNCSYATIQKFVNESMGWILRTQEVARSKYKTAPPKQYTEGETFLYLGNSYELVIGKASSTPLTFEGQNFILAVDHAKDVKELFRLWYKRAAYEKIAERVNYYSSHTGIECGKVNITSARSRWGSCSVKGNLNFSWHLIMAPLAAIDSVVVHELVHIRERNHSAKFWKKVKALSPEYDRHKDWLKKNQNLLSL